VRGIPPILHDCAVVEVCLQTERLGWHTDDFLIVCENGSGNRRRLAGQVKRTFTVSATDDECKKAVQDFWKDFKNPQLFSLAADRFALVTFRGTNTLLEHFSGLLDCARAARDGADFGRRLATPGVLSVKAVHYCDEIRAIIGEFEAKSVSVVEIWPFLRVLHILSLDLNTATRQTEAMIESLLAYTTVEPDAIGAAEASWNALLREVGEGMPEGRCIQRDDLPEVLRQRHSLLGGAEQRALRALSEHSSLILAGIRSTIGRDMHLGRDGLVQEVIGQLESTQVVLISGAAGSGKSCVAKDAVGVLATDHFAFSFRAEEFAHPHFDETLQSIQVPANAAILGAILASQDRKVLLVESVERLLEKATRDAFADLLTLIARDKSWRLVLTCRDYSTDLVRTCFLASASVGHSVVTVPPLDDAELAEVGTAHPMLSIPLAIEGVRRILRNPYVLDKALQISWSEEQPLPQSERQFRVLFWREIVRADQHTRGGMPRRREDAFVQIALRRARALTLYAASGDLDPEAVEGLRSDSLIVSPRETSALAAPAHDVLEDWAILWWVEEQYVLHEGSAEELSAAIGTHPAVRRTYRKWATELVEWDPTAADRLFQGILREGELSAQFRDDTLVSLLRSPSSAAFLERHTAELFANDKHVLRRVIHLLRVACVTTPAWMKALAIHPSFLVVPEGSAWACVLQLVQTRLSLFSPEDVPLLLGLIEDWARGVTWQMPYPDAADRVAVIGYWLLLGFDDYRSNDQRKRTLQVIAKIPNADRERFAILLRGTQDGEERDRATEDFRGIILEGLEGAAAARDMPELVVSAAKDYLLCSETDLQSGLGYAGSEEVETLLGIKPGRSFRFFPASAYKGPFLALLRNHPREGIAFVIDVINHSADWYAHPRVRLEYIEPPGEITLTFATGASRTQWCNARLWNLYRGTPVGPYALQSLLMALERFLLELGEAYPGELDAVFLSILQRSDSAALTAVVASVATAFPHASGETLLVLLSSPMCIRLDRRRLVNESHVPSRLFGMMPRLDNRNKVYEEERKEADALPHRHYDLETAISNLQLGPLAPRVHEVLDRYRAEMRPVEKQAENDRVWRLAMHRMDLRHYTVAEDRPDAVDANTQEPTPDERHYVRLVPGVPEADVKEMVDSSAARSEAINASLGLLMWGKKVYDGEVGTEYDPHQWRQRLEEARAARLTEKSDDEEDLAGGGPGIVAAVCVRDHWEEMTGDERNWSVDLVCSEVERQGDLWNRFAREQRYNMSADRFCAWILSSLFGKSLSEAQRSRVRQLLVVALTHAITEIRWYAAWGIGNHLWTIDRDLALRCTNALAKEATSVQQAIDADSKRPYRERRQVDEIEAESAKLVRQRFFEAGGIAADSYQIMDPTTWFGAEANGRILAILGQAPTEPSAIAGFAKLAHTLIEWWNADDDRRSAPHERRRERNHDTESTLTDLLLNFLLRTSAAAAATILQPILDAIDRHSRKVHWLLRGLIAVEDRQPNTPQFWSLWEMFADRIRRAEWLEGIDDEYASGNEMISAVFLGASWKADVRHWRSLEGHAQHVDALFEDLPASSAVLENYVRFLHHVGEQSLPEAFIRIAKRLQQADTRAMIGNANTVFLLEILLQRYVYGRPLELKRERALRDAVLLLLDLLVENGSSAAFRMRDDFVTPISIG